MKNALCVAGLLVLSASVYATSTPPAVQGRTGRVAGNVRLAVARNLSLPTSAYGRRGVPPKPGAVGPETRRVVVYLSGVKANGPIAPMRATIAQREEQFVPMMTAVTVGSTVDFPNQDPFFHNVFSLSRAAEFDLGRYPSGKTREWVFRRPGLVKVFCHLHAHMSALIRVFDHPWFTIPAADGTFVIDDVPVGEHSVVAWHERIGEVNERLQITAGQTTRVSFTLPVLEKEP